ncbi:MAG: hypothetical protein H0X43_04930 [Nitrosospira sp.]|nr:hypothetical protein [Nitrosospira sp.]
MRKLPLVLIGLLIAFALVLITVLVLVIENSPRIDRRVTLTPEHIGRAKEIIDTHRDWVHPGMLAVTTVMPADADLAANYLAHRLGKGSAQVTVADRSAIVRLSLPTTSTPLAALKGYLNLEAILVETDGLPRLQSLRIGNILLPDVLTGVLAYHLRQWLRESPEYRAGIDALRQVKMSRNELSIVYRWAGGVTDEMRTSMVDERERKRLLRYQTLLANRSQSGAEVSLAEILPTLARIAPDRSGDGDIVAENRAIILVSAFHVLGVSLERVLPEAATWPRPAPQKVTLDGRDDFAKHFMVSAAIAAYADTALSDAIGLYKEIEDSRTGSGFSFNDIAADRAGTQFGEKAVASKESARELQRRIASGLEDRDLMPMWSDLPEFLSEAEFTQRFGGTDAPAYQEMMQKIEQRVTALQVLHQESPD